MNTSQFLVESCRATLSPRSALSRKGAQDSRFLVVGLASSRILPATKAAIAAIIAWDVRHLQCNQWPREDHLGRPCLGRDETHSGGLHFLLFLTWRLLQARKILGCRESWPAHSAMGSDGNFLHLEGRPGSQGFISRSSREAVPLFFCTRQSA